MDAEACEYRLLLVHTGRAGLWGHTAEPIGPCNLEYARRRAQEALERAEVVHIERRVVLPYERTETLTRGTG